MTKSFPQLINRFPIQIPIIADLPGVGRNLQDHIGAYGLTWLTSRPGAAYNPFSYTTDPATYWKWAMTGDKTGEQMSDYICIVDGATICASFTDPRQNL